MKYLVTRVLTIATLVPIAFSGWPSVIEPPQPIFGLVRDIATEPVTNGMMSVVYSSLIGDVSVVVTGELERVVGRSGREYSYLIEIPMETRRDGVEPTPNTLLLDWQTTQLFVRTIEVPALGITNTRLVSVDAKSRGRFTRTDLCASMDCNEWADFHMADLDRDNRFSLTEVLLVLSYFNATNDSAYQTGSGPDGFSFGAGAKAGPRHNVDYDEIPWRISLTELLVFLAMFNESPCHGYLRDFDDFDNDGYKAAPELCPDTKSLDDEEQLSSSPGTLATTRRIAGISTDTGLVLEVTINYRYQPGAELTVAGVEEVLPPDWGYLDTLITSDTPSILPLKGESGFTEFAWFPDVADSRTFTYRIQVDSPEVLSEQLDALTGNVLFHVKGIDAGFREPIQSHVTTDGQSDLDADGIPDALEQTLPGEADVDDDGIPNWIDLDSDGDGILDAEDLQPYGGTWPESEGEGEVLGGDQQSTPAVSISSRTSLLIAVLICLLGLIQLGKHRLAGRR